jgi:hypothetical protein
MLTRLFWTVVALDAVAALLLWKLLARGTHGLIIAAYLFVLTAIALPTCIFPLLRPEGLRNAAFIFLLLPSASLLYWSFAATLTNVQEQRQFSGSAYFQGPALQLAQAMIKRDAGLVKQLIPAAGDLNQPHGDGVTLWRYGVLQADDSDQSLQMLRALLAAGADAKRDTTAAPLQHAFAVSPRLTRFLLDAGSNPNLLDHEHLPLWWRTIVQGEDDTSTELLRMMLDHPVDLSLRAPDGRGPVAQAIAMSDWYAACLLIERGADWKQEKVRNEAVLVLLEWEILRREEYPLPVPEKLRKVLAEAKGEPLVIPAKRTSAASDIRVPDLLQKASLDNLEETRTGLSQLAHQRPDWARRVEAFFGDGDVTQRNRVALLLSLKPEALSEGIQERCWEWLREQTAWYDLNAKSTKEHKAWLLRDPAFVAVQLASIAGPVRDRHRADFISLRDRIEQCRKANDPDAGKLADLKKADWIAG